MHVRANADSGLVTLTGRLDLHTVPDVRQALRRAIDSGGGELVVDLAAVQMVDAVGLGALVSAHRRAGRAGRTLVLRRVPGSIARLLFVTRLDRVLRIDEYAGV